MARVTIIIPSYNHQNYIEQRLDSILDQSYKDWEAIIIDDKSSDASVEIIENYLKKNPEFTIKAFIKNENNSGSGYKSWQKGIELAQTKFIWIAETDDYCEPNFLETTVSALQSHPTTVLAFTGSNYVNEYGEFLYNSSKRFSKLKLKTDETRVFDGEVTIKDLPINPLITNGSSVVFRKPITTIPDIIFQNKQISDLFLWTYLVRASSFICINQMLNAFRRHDASTTTINFGENNSKVYEEYVRFVNYFQLGVSKSSKVEDHYIKHFLIPNRKKVGYFYTKPIQVLHGFSKLSLIMKITKAYVGKAFKN
ncbi:glycosyltransferase [Winogradskyella sp.]|nr:glycosyltransferase [Winogradskyella sp.]MDC1505646.1 glycosyltransferase [Winogradskyella sp.]